MFLPCRQFFVRHSREGGNPVFGFACMNDLWAALCLVAVLEGLFLFAAPGAWKRAAEQLQQMPDEHVRRVGGIVLILGIVSLYFVRG